MENADHISHETAIAVEPQAGGKRPVVTLQGLREAFSTVVAGGAAALLIGGLVYGRITGKDTPDRIETLHQRANLSFLPMSGNQRAALQDQIQMMEYQQFLKQEAALRGQGLVHATPIPR